MDFAGSKKIPNQILKLCLNQSLNNVSCHCTITSNYLIDHILIIKEPECFPQTPRKPEVTSIKIKPNDFLDIPISIKIISREVADKISLFSRQKTRHFLRYQNILI